MSYNLYSEASALNQLSSPNARFSIKSGFGILFEIQEDPLVLLTNSLASTPMNKSQTIPMPQNSRTQITKENLRNNTTQKILTLAQILQLVNPTFNPLHCSFEIINVNLYILDFAFETFNLIVQSLCQSL